MSGSNLVVVEGGPKGIRKFTHLMLHRIAWDVMLEGDGNLPPAPDGNRDESHMDADEEKEEDDEEEKEEGGASLPLGQACLSKDNRCDLLWTGILPKRVFQGFKFQECKSAPTARKLLEAKGVAHYWDMAYRADEMLEVAKI